MQFFKATIFRLLNGDDCTEFNVPIAVTVKKYTLPPDCFIVEINEESLELRFYNPSESGGSVQTSFGLQQWEIEWARKYLKRATKFDCNLWSLPEEENYVLKTMFDKKYKTARNSLFKTLIEEQSPYSPTDTLLRFVQGVFGSLEELARAAREK